MNEINQPLNDDVFYELPARVVRLSLAGSAFIRLFLYKDINIDSDISYDKPKNVFLKGVKKQSFEVGNYILVKAKGWIVNQFLVSGEIGEKNNDDRSVSFIKKLTKQQYQKYLDENDVILSFDKITNLKNKKQKLLDEIQNLEADLGKKDKDLNQSIERKAKELKEYLDSIQILKEISDLEKSKEFLKQEQQNLIDNIQSLKGLSDLEECNNNLEKEKQNLLKFKQENKWIEGIKHYIDVENNTDIDRDKNLEIKPKELFNDIAKSLKDRFDLSNDFINCYLLSLFTSLIQGRFLLLTGHIGTGKSSIIKETGKLMGGQTNMVAVRPAWLDASDLLGYFDPINNRYNGTEFVKFLRKQDNNRINLILLDELNIARIENYGADILACLSPINQRKEEQNKISLFNQDLQEVIFTYQMYDKLSPEYQSQYQIIFNQIKQSANIRIADNVLICGTLNIDGSTENLSPKMIDRSFILKFPDFDGKLGNIKEIKDIYNMPIHQIVQMIENFDKIDVKKWNTFYDTYIAKIKNYLVPISNRVAKDYLVFWQCAKLLGVNNQKVDMLFFYARILPRLKIEKLDNDNKQAILSVLNSFLNNQLFDVFINQINDSKNDGNFIDYQHICG